jgi:hypothetical protein
MRPILLPTVLALLLGGCGTIFDFSVPRADRCNPSGAEVVPGGLSGAGNAGTTPCLLGSYADVARDARFYRDDYRDRGGSAATAPQVFDMGVLGSAIYAIAANSLRWGTNGATTAAITGASIAAVGAYYNPRTRRDIYFNGATAMQCIVNLATNLDNERALHSPLLQAPTLRGDALMAPLQRSGISSSARATLVANLNTLRTTVQQLAAAMEAINVHVVKSAADASRITTLSAIASALVTEAQAAAKAKIAAQAAIEEAAKAGQGARRALADAELNALITLTDIATSLPLEIAACKALAGAS